MMPVPSRSYASASAGSSSQSVPPLRPSSLRSTRVSVSVNTQQTRNDTIPSRQSPRPPIWARGTVARPVVPSTQPTNLRSTRSPAVAVSSGPVGSQTSSNANRRSLETPRPIRRNVQLSSANAITPSNRNRHLTQAATVPSTTRLTTRRETREDIVADVVSNALR